MTTLKDHLIQILSSRDFKVDENEGYLYGRREDISVVVMAASDLLLDDVHDFLHLQRLSNNPMHFFECFSIHFSRSPSLTE